MKIFYSVSVDDKYSVFNIARRDGYRITSIDESNTAVYKKCLNLERINIMLSKVTADELVMMTRNLGSMLTAGLTVTRALSVIERQSKNLKTRHVIKRVVERINNGEQFFEALKEFPEASVAITVT